MRGLLPNLGGSSGAGRCGPSTSPTCDQLRRSLVRPSPRTKHHRTKENPAHASQHAQVEETQAQRQTKSTEEGSSGVQNCASNFNNRKGPRIVTAPPGARKRPCVASHYNRKVRSRIRAIRHPPPSGLARHARSSAGQTPGRDVADPQDSRLRCLRVRNERVDARRNRRYLRCQRSSDPNRHLRLCGVETACTFRPSALRLRATA